MPPTHPMTLPQRSSPIARLQAELTNAPLVTLQVPSYLDRVTREEAFSDPNLPIYAETGQAPEDLWQPLCLRPPQLAQRRAFESHSMDSHLLTERNSTADTDVVSCAVRCRPHPHRRSGS